MKSGENSFFSKDLITVKNQYTKLEIMINNFLDGFGNSTHGGVEKYAKYFFKEIHRKPNLYSTYHFPEILKADCEVVSPYPLKMRD